MSLKFYCNKVMQATDYDGRAITQVELMAHMGPGCVPSGPGGNAVVVLIPQDEIYKWKPGGAYYASFRSAEEVADTK